MMQIIRDIGRRSAARRLDHIIPGGRSLDAYIFARSCKAHPVLGLVFSDHEHSFRTSVRSEARFDARPCLERASAPPAWA
ncbi:hypothetical protein PsYK624_068970 [Phanerochaete sordida]|uniref:Uncharacterized protein n=1 Tax=Phanerochaete sordida TaxID=48140 RepID=A0A9P3G7J1_9APHY|nr:hypothetical protein PsYK624_068970 [Phanerochaete sordida]